VAQAQIALAFPFKYLLYCFDVISVENNVSSMPRVYFVIRAILFADLEKASDRKP
jgi:hypothetical protein